MTKSKAKRSSFDNRDINIVKEHIEHDKKTQTSPPLSALMKELSGLFLIAAKQRYTNSGITISRSCILMCLSHREGIAQQDIVKYARMKPASISCEIADMEREGLIVRKKSESDARTYQIYLTDKGREVDSNIKESFKRVEEAMLSGIDEKLKDEIKESLFKMRENILAYIEKGEN